MINMDLDLTNKALQPLTGFAIQLNKNSFGLACANNLQISVLQPNQATSTSLTLNTSGPVMKMTPITNLQVAVKNNIDVFYFSVVVPMHVFFAEDGEIDKRLFLNTWKEIPEQNESQFQLTPFALGAPSADDLCNKLRNNNVFTIAKRNVEGQDMLYQSMKLTNGIWILSELKVTPGNPSLTVSHPPSCPESYNTTLHLTAPHLCFQLSLKSKTVDVISSVKDAYELVLHSS